MACIPSLPVVADEWTERAACRGEEPDLFFPASQLPEFAVSAKDVCRYCPVRQACLDAALDRGEKHGIWGGLTEEERRKYRRRAAA